MELRDAIKRNMVPRSRKNPSIVISILPTMV